MADKKAVMGLPRWMFDATGQSFLVAIRPDNIAVIDGGHSDAEGVAKARELFQRLDTIRPPEGTRYVMVRVEEVPPFGGAVNEEAIGLLNHAERRRIVPTLPPSARSENG